MLIFVVSFVSRILSAGLNQTTNSVHRCITKMTIIMFRVFLQVIDAFGEVFLMEFVSISRVTASAVCKK